MDLTGRSRKPTVYNIHMCVHFLDGAKLDVKKGSFFIVMLLHFKKHFFELQNSSFDTYLMP